jgi:L-ascorbate metabolism protein UlaG (beta-lactamase superfamily)
MKITFYGHAALGIKVGGKHILVDPLYLEPPAEHIDIDSLKRIIFY